MRKLLEHGKISVARPIGGDRRAHLKDRALYRRFYDADLHPGVIHPPYREEPRLLWALAHVEERSDVVDIGCHKGELTFPLWSLTAGRVVGVDISERAIRTARAFSLQRGIDGIEWAVAEAESLPYPDDTFDVAILTDILEHVVDPDVVLREAERVVRDGGTIVISVPANALEMDAIDAIERDPRLGFYLDMHVREYIPAVALAGRCGLVTKDETVTRTNGEETASYRFRLASYDVRKGTGGSS